MMKNLFCYHNICTRINEKKWGFIFFYFITTNCFSQSNTLQGTLVFLASIKDEMIIVADKRETDQDGNFHDEAKKIQQIGKYSFLATTGIAYMQDEGFTNRVTFDAASDLNSYFKGSDPDFSEKGKQSIAEAIDRNFNKYLASIPPNNRPSPKVNPLLYNVLIGKFDHKKNKFQFSIFHQYYSENTTSILTKVTWESSTEAFFAKTNFYYAGDTKVVELASRDSTISRTITDETYRELSRGNIISGYLPREKVLSFCKSLIDFSFNNSHLIQLKRSFVGPTVDVALIDPKDGFKWFQKNVPASINK